MELENNEQDKNEQNSEFATDELEINDLTQKEEDDIVTYSSGGILSVAILSAIFAVLVLSFLPDQELIVSLFVAGLAGALFGWIFFALTQAQKDKLKSNTKNGRPM